MILLHEQMQMEATHLKPIIEDVFGVPVHTLGDDLDRFFVQLPKFEGYLCDLRLNVLYQEFPRSAVLLLIRRDLYMDLESREEGWVLGVNLGPFSVVSTARLMGSDNSPRMSLAVDEDLYLRRVALMAVHELGHDLVRQVHHYIDVTWVSLRTKHEQKLGPHCPDNSCAMYEVVDITAPPPEEGYLTLM
jgi:predicted Zn-dependent protease